MKTITKLILSLLLIFISKQSYSQWTDITSTFGGGITANTNMSRPLICDINNDNYPDILVNILITPTSPYTKYFRLLKNNGNNSFTDVTSVFGLPLDLIGTPGFIDYDGDGFKDLYFWTSTELTVYKNNGGTSLSNVSTQLGINNNFFASGGITSYASVFDFDIDGDEDVLYTRVVAGAITLTAIVNNTNSLSTKLDLITNIPGNSEQGVSFSFADVDNDGDFDLLFDTNVSGQFNNGITSIYTKNPSGYINTTSTSGLPTSLPAACEIFDINQDGNLDIIKGGSDCCSGPLSRVFIGVGNGTFTDQTAAYNIVFSWYKGNGTHVDIDNDADFDFSWSYNYGNGASCRVLANNNNLPTYVDVTNTLGLSYPNTAFDYAQFGVWCDIDNDGDLDVINNNDGWGAVTSGNVWVKLNPTQGNYLNIKLAGCGVNKSGIGARIKVDIGTKTRWLYYEKSTAGANGINDDIFHFGLGNATTVSAITVFWPNNTTTVLNNVPGNQNLVITGGTSGTATITPAGATTICQGGSVVLNANTGAGLTYQWYNNAVAISGATSASYNATTDGSYTVTVTNASTCSATSTATVVTVNSLPTATITPATPTTFCQGGSVVLNANTGAGLSYQWFNNAVAISGATSSSHTANASGSYTVVVTNTSACSATSTATIVTVNALPTATITPAAAATFCQGGSVVLNDNSGTGLSYQWFNNAVAISGATNASYTANASGSYTVVVTNTSTCSATSTATVVTVNAIPTATITPATTTTFCQGESVVLNANSGTGFTYQWRLNGTNITGATSSSYTANASGSYTVVVTNTSACSATSTATVATVNALPTATITPATATTFCQGGSVVLNANTGTGLTYQWRLNGTNITGATTASYTANASGSYTVVVTNTSTCSATSSAVNVLVNSNTTYFADTDNDGYGNLGSTISACIQPVGYVLNSLDCNDANAAINTAAAEICNSIDDNCNSQTDEGLTFTLYYADADGDGFGAGASNSLCSSPGSGYSTNALDCNNLNASINPSATELCNNADDNCNSQIDEGLFFQNYYQDFDGDGFGFGSASSLCASQSGYVSNAFDCNDFQAQINPVAQETCNGIDDNCNTLVDDGLQFSNYFLDGDQDGFGSGSPQSLCNNPGNGYSLVNTDCNDALAVINPSATETCNSIDDNCNLQIDEGLVFANYFSDNDGDGFGSPAQAFPSCVPLSGMVTNNSDCNDANANINPLVEDIGGNGIDENCDGQIDNSILELNASINLFPNPTRSELNVQVNSSVIGSDLYIFDAVGKLVRKQQLLSTQTAIPVSNFADGNYIVRVGEVVKRFVVQK